MPNQFVVPQFIDAEDKIIGPLTVRQFIILIVGMTMCALFWRLFDFSLFVLLSVPTIILTGTIAFLRVNGVGVHFFFLNLIQTLRKPMLRVWDKTIPDSILRERIKPKKIIEKPVITRKGPLSGSRLRELSLVVNTGGAFNPEEE